MLSILIPVYNFNIVPLVAELHQQAQRCAVPVEIICLDDYSQPEFKRQNQQLTQFSTVFYQELPKNIGRSAIRNQLAKLAKQPYLLFLDGDVLINHSDYLNQYLKKINSHSVICGGRSYAAEPPPEKKYLLHYKYGQERECQPAAVRQTKCWDAFITGNFLIEKELFLSIQFEEKIRHYGHEDTLFGQVLKNKNIPVLHIDNPVVHIGLEPAPVFLEKQNQAIHNLYQIYQQKLLIESRLLSIFKKLKKSRLDWPVYQFLKKMAPLLKERLLSGKGSIRELDLYKLHYLLDIDKKHHSLVVPDL